MTTALPLAQHPTASKKIAFSDAVFTPRFAHGDMAQIAQITGTGEGTQLGTGMARFTDADIPWTVKYDEVLLVLEGEVTIHMADQTLIAGPKDCLWLPKGTELRYQSKNALVFYAIHPANWAEEAA